MRSVGERIRQARQAKRWSAEKLAGLVGYRTQSGIANIENRSRGNGGSRLPQIAEALNVPLAWLLAGPDSDDVPFIASAPAVLRAEDHERRSGYTTPRSAPPAAPWPFPGVPVTRVQQLLARLPTADSRAAREEMERAILLIVEHWEHVTDPSQVRRSSG